MTVRSFRLATPPTLLTIGKCNLLLIHCASESQQIVFVCYCVCQMSCFFKCFLSDLISNEKYDVIGRRFSKPKGFDGGLFHQVLTINWLLHLVQNEATKPGAQSSS
jgi:hypothetical protein